MKDLIQLPYIIIQKMTETDFEGNNHIIQYGIKILKTYDEIRIQLRPAP